MYEVLYITVVSDDQQHASRKTSCVTTSIMLNGEISKYVKNRNSYIFIIVLFE